MLITAKENSIFSVGRTWPEEVANALHKAAYFVVFVSPHAIASKNVRNEINFALTHAKPFVAIHLTKTDLPPGLQLSIGSVQAIMKYRMDNRSYRRKIQKILPPELRSLRNCPGSGPALTSRTAENISPPEYKSPGAVTRKRIPVLLLLALTILVATATTGLFRHFWISSPGEVHRPVEQKLEQQAKEATPLSSSDESQQSKYLPLSVGNKWTYKKTVTEGAKVFFIKPYPHGNKESILRGPSPIKAGVAQETFLVKDHKKEDGMERWEITITPKTARDGRYGAGPFGNADTILWGRVISSGDVIEIGEIFVYNPSTFEPEERRRTLPLLVEPLSKDADVSITGNFPGKYGCSHERVTIEVPAGKYEGCLEMVQEVRGSGEDKGWTTHSYFASGVGLVKELQRDENGKITYILELLKFDSH